MTGDLYIKGTGTNNQFVDAYTTFGMSLEDTGISRILCPAPNKQPVTNKNVNVHGATIVAGTGCKEERTIGVPFHIVAASKTAFNNYYDALCDLLDGGWVDVKLARKPNTVFHFQYIDCQQYTEYNGEMAIFNLQLYEPNPNVRT